MATTELDPRQTLDALITHSENAMIQGLTGTIELLDEQTATEQQYTDAVTTRESEIAAVNERWQPQIRELQVNRQDVERKISKAAEQIGRKAIRGYKEHTVSSEELIYVDSLFGTNDRYSHGSSTTIKHDQAASELERYRRFVRGAPFLACAYSRMEYGRPSTIRDIYLSKAGILSDKPDVQLPHNASAWCLDPQLNLTFKDGRTYTHEWSKVCAVGKEEAEQVASVWAYENKLAGRRHTHRLEIDTALEGLAILAPLKLKLPGISKLRAEALDQVTFREYDEAQDVGRLLTSIRTVGGHRLFTKHVRLLAKEKRLDEETLTKSVAEALVPNYLDKPAVERYGALEAAAKMLAGK